MNKKVMDFVEYYPETGSFTWKPNTKFAGKPAFNSLNTRGYARALINSKRMYAHRAAWEICHGEIPEGYEIDHINRNPSDNRLCNLRLATKSQNSANVRSIGKTSQFRGVSWYKEIGKWQVSVGKNRKVWCIGYFENEVDAAKAYDAKATELHGEFANLNFPQGDD